MAEANLDLYQVFLQKRNEALHVPVKPPPKKPGEDPHAFYLRARYIQPTPENARALLDLTSHLPAQRAQRLLTNEYVYENLASFLAKTPEGLPKIDPKRVALALEVKEKIGVLADIYEYEPQYMAAITTSGYAAVEYIRDQNLRSLDPSSLKNVLGELRQKEREHAQHVFSTQKDRKGSYVYMRGKAVLLRYLTRYAYSYDPKTHGNFEDYVLRSLTQELHQRLGTLTADLAILNQPQGYEVEVLKRIISSKKAQERGVSEWLPRGIPIDRHERTDWQLIPIFSQGLTEDIGERKYQVFEVSSEPTESMPILTSSIMALTAAGFFDEEELSDIYEGYSLHVSSVFPKNILTKDSLAQYTQMARSLSSAFASRQRIAFGGFMSGGSEVSDKSDAGTLREIKKVKDPARKGRPPIAKDLSLVEIRNLDLTPRSHYKALLSKQYLDFAFTSFWKGRLNGTGNISRLETLAADAWESYFQKTSTLFERYGISSDTDKAWKEISATIDHHKEFRSDMKKTIRRTVTKIREAIDATRDEEQRTYLLRQPHRVLPEPLSRQDDMLYLSALYRRRMGVSVGDVLHLSWEGKTRDVRIAPAFIRGNHEIDGARIFRPSPNILQKLGIPLVSEVTAQYDPTNRNLIISPSQRERNLALITQPRPIIIESGSTKDNRIYINTTDREKLGIKPGETISLRIGKISHSLIVAPAKIQEDGSAWKFSPNVLGTFGIPQGVALRMRFDQTTKELAAGPTIGILNTDTKPERTLFGRRTKMLTQLCKTTQEIGGLAVIINPNDPVNQDLQHGFVTGYIVDGFGAFHKVRVPAPDVIYDRDLSFHPKSSQWRDIESIYPAQLQEITRSKQKLSDILGHNEYLRPFLLDTLPLTNLADLKDFLTRHEKIFLKPNEGQQGIGLITVAKTDQGYMISHPYIEQGSWKLSESFASTVEGLYKSLQELQKGKSTFLMQEYLDMKQVQVGTRRDGTPIRRSIELRHVLQRGADERLGVVGVVSRLSDKKLIGKEYHLDSFETLLKAFPRSQAQHIFEQSKRLAIAITHYLEQQGIKAIGELTIDIGVGRNGQLYVIEANSKAETRGMFEEAGNTDAAQTIVTNPIYYATALSGFA